MFLCPREMPSNNFHQLNTNTRSLMNKSHLQSCAVEALCGLNTVGESTELPIDMRPPPRILRDALDVLEDA